ncbi:putative protease [Providencia alcalifaciens]|nr:putative protease [Providencia alcalifaciens]
MLSQEQQQVFTLNGIQTLSGYCYNLGNDISSMRDLVDIVRVSPEDLESLNVIKQFKANQHGQSPLTIPEQSCNGYWRNIAGLTLAG